MRWRRPASSMPRSSAWFMSPPQATEAFAAPSTATRNAPWRPTCSTSGAQRSEQRTGSSASTVRDSATWALPTTATATSTIDRRRMTRAGMLTERFEAALSYALEAHGEQLRKGTLVPYAAHLLGVVSLVLEAGGNEDEAIAGLLHDVAEDVGMDLLSTIRDRFGDAVADAVLECSAEEKSTGLGWRERKERYIDGLAVASTMALRVSLADKVYNARAILADFRQIGDELWTRFNAGGADDVLWYYSQLEHAYARRAEELDPRLVDELGRSIGQLRLLLLRPRCPECGAGDVVPIVLGLPASEEDFALGEAGASYFSGCVVDDPMPEWSCRVCSAQWGRQKLTE